MSQNQTGRNLKYTVYVGEVDTITATIEDSAGNVKDLSNTTTYATVKIHVWKPDGTLIINGSGTYSNRGTGQVSYTLVTGDTVLANAGNWEGIFLLYNNSGILTEPSAIFNFSIEKIF